MERFHKIKIKLELSIFLCNTLSMFEQIELRLKEAKIIPVVKVQDIQLALELAQTLQNSGMKAIEITFRTNDGKEGLKKIADCIIAIKKEFPKLLVGAGTVINASLAKEAKKSNADFLVSPGFNPKTVKWCISHKIPFFPGISTPGEIEQALECGLKTLKLFPAEILGGESFIKSLAGPFPQTTFIPTGGINNSNYKSYLNLKNVVAVGGSWMCPEKLIKGKNWIEIKNICTALQN